MHFIFLLARVYPYWALAVSMILVQLAVFFRRRGSLANQWTCLGSAAFLICGILAWFIFRGDLYSDDWVRVLTGGS